ncbi:endonuclease NucS [Candidatus Woesearchaeota archaeon]|nr:endonuclease NucS [Candidatus Woesearchaeota archaeon]
MWKKEEVCSLLKDAVARREIVVLAAKCEIKYSGRAESYLGDGDRLIILKEDYSLLVHQPQGNAPVNYMKSGTIHSSFVEDGFLFLKCENLVQKEFLTIIMKKVYFFNSHKLNDSQKIVLQGNEADMANMIYKAPEIIEDGFKPVSQEEQTAYGFIDVLGTDKEDILTVVECKRYCADLAAVTQLRRYVERIMDAKGLKNVRGILAAPRITDNAKKMLEDWGYSFVSVIPPKYLAEYSKSQSKLDEY